MEKFNKTTILYGDMKGGAAIYPSVIICRLFLAQ